jgi:hypothetical protein
MIKCSECGYENIDGLDYCDGCGAKLNAAAAAAPAGESGGAAAAAEPAAAETAAPEAPETPPPSETPTGEIKPPPEASATAAAAAPAPEAPAAPAAAGSTARAKLQVVRGGRKGQEFPLEDGNNLVGRWDPETGSFPEVDLDQDDPEAKISRKHALIRFEASKITVEDIGSLNGTYVNRQPRLMPGNPVELKSGDEIIIGKTFLKLIVEPVS